MIGQILGHYRILEQIGAGGMGVVYRAHDEQLDRDVALKVLPAGTLADEAARRRFRKEALVLAKLNHPHIETIHEFGSQDATDFLVAEYISGITLDAKLMGGALPEKEAVRLGAQLAEGLEVAHEQGIVHRDLKPTNLRLAEGVRIKILDFGLAVLSQPEGEAGLTASFTRFQQVSGTLPYMAPEQLRGERVDARSDIWAAGAVLYEMATGRRPFEAKLPTVLAGDILHTPPAPPRAVSPAISPQFEEIILKCLDKEPERRYQSARDLQLALERLSTRTLSTQAEHPNVLTRHGFLIGLKRQQLVLGSAASLVLVAVVAVFLYFALGHREQIDSLAILPFANATHDPNLEYLSDGITESLINSLSQIPRLTVISRNAVFHYKGGEPDAKAAGRDLHVQAVLLGRVSMRGDMLSISTELVDARSSAHLWGEQYNRKMSDILSLQQDITGRVSERLRLKLNSAEQKQLAKRYTDNTEAYQLYLKGRYQWNKRSEETIRQGIEYFQQAVVLDPNFALAYDGIADAYINLGIYPRAKAAALKALAIDDTLGEDHSSLAAVSAFSDWDWMVAEREFRRAIALSPSYAQAHSWFGEYLTIMRRFDEAIKETKKAEELDPLSPVAGSDVAYPLFMSRQYEAAFDNAGKSCRQIRTSLLDTTS